MDKEPPFISDLHPLANSVRTFLLIEVDNELKQSKKIAFKLNNEDLSSKKNDEIYVLLEDTLYDSSTNRSEVYSASSTNSKLKFTPSESKKLTCSLGPFSKKPSNDVINKKNKVADFQQELIKKSPSLKKKDFIQEINLKSDLKQEVYNAYRKLRNIANSLKNKKGSVKNLKSRLQGEPYSHSFTIKESSRVFSCNSNDNSFLSEGGFNMVSMISYVKPSINEGESIINIEPRQGKNLTPVQIKSSGSFSQKKKTQDLVVKSSSNKYINYVPLSIPQREGFQIKLKKCL